MYKCSIYKDVFPTDPKESQDNIPVPVSLLFRVQLPFPPYLGLEIMDGSLSSNALKTITWDVENKEFYCHVAYEYPVNIFGGGDFKDLVNWAVEEGWIMASYPKEYINLFGERPKN